MKKILLLAAPLLFLFPDMAFAADTTSQDVLETLAVSVGIFIKTLNQLLWPFLLMIGGLMENDMITGPGMLERLRFIYVEVRDLVNIAFAVFLLVVALYNSLPFADADGNLAIKNAVPRLILGVILVNFTFMIGRVVIDMSTVVNSAVFALPEAVQDFDFDEEQNKLEKSFCMHEDANGDLVPWSTSKDGADEIPIPTGIFCEEKEGEPGEYTGQMTPYIANTYFSRLNSSNVALVMAVNMGAIEQLGLLKADSVDSVKALIVNGLFSLIMYAIFVISYLVLALVLLARVIVLWFALAFSPLAVLTYVIPGLADQIGGGGGDIVQRITKHLLAPVIIGITLTVGYLMISAYSEFSAGFGGVAAVLNGVQSQAIDQSFLLSGVSDFERLMIAVATIMVVWTGVFAAAEGTLAEFATSTIKDLGSSVGSAIARAPLLLPIIPIATPGGGAGTSVSPLAYFGAGKKLLRSFNDDTYLQDDYKKLGEKIPALRKAMGMSEDIKTPNQRTLGVENYMRQVGNKIGPDDIKYVARELYQAGKDSGKLDSSLVSKLEDISKKDAQNVNYSDFEAIREIARDNKDKFGVEEAEFERRVIQPLTDSPITFDAKKRASDNNLNNVQTGQGTQQQETQIQQNSPANPPVQNNQPPQNNQNPPENPPVNPPENPAVNPPANP